MTRRLLPRGVTPYHALVLLGALPLLGLSVFAYVLSARAVEGLVDANNDATATIAAATVEREFEQWHDAFRSYAGFPVLSAAVSAGDVDAVRARLEIVVDAFRRIDRAFVTDNDGRLWVDYPVAPESLGRRFDGRDWYRGVREADSDGYISEVYQRHAKPRLFLVAVAVPVTDPATGARSGYLVGQVRLDGLSEMLRKIEVGAGGHAVLLDHTGAVVAHPSLDLRARRYTEYADAWPDLADAIGEDVRSGRYVDPFTGEEMVASAREATIGAHRWHVVAQQPTATAFASNDALAWQLAGGGLFLAVLVGGLVWGLGRENTRRRQAEAALVDTNEELERRVRERTAALRQKEDQLLHAQKMEAIGQLAGGVAHDFNNLLTVIIGTTMILRHETDEDAPLRADLDEILEASQRAADLTRQLLAFSRKQVVAPEVLDLNAVVDRVRTLLDRVLGEHIQLACKLREDLHPVKVDPGQLEQVLMNLAVNARDAMPRGGKLTITTANVDLDDAYVEDHADARPGPHAVMTVSDTGAGMDAATRQRIFEPFFTTKKLGHGTGLGLSIVYGIVRQAGGTIWVYSELGRGTTFKVYLPRTEDVPMPARSRSDETRQAEGQSILVVEDEPAVRALLVRVLIEAGYRVLEAEDAAAARAIFDAEGERVDLLLTDVVLPHTGGPELAKELSARRADLRVLYMSGYTDDAIVHRGELDEGVAFIEKPLRPSDLLAKVSEVIWADAPT